MFPAPRTSAFRVGLGGSLGSVARWGLSQALARPLATLVANLAGCLAIGALLALPLSSGWRAFLVVGLLGGFTTFSTFAGETVGLWTEGARGAAALYLGASVGLGLLAVVFGGFLARGLGAP